jgi:hypothetical protein
MLHPESDLFCFANECSQGLLEIVQGGALQAISPTRSIPETIPDTNIADSQSQHQGIEAPGALELVQSLLQAEQVTTQDHSEAATVQDSNREQPVARTEGSEETAIKPAAESEAQAVISPCVERSALRASIPEQPKKQVVQTLTSFETVENGSLQFINIEEIHISSRNSSTFLGDESNTLPVAAGDLGEVTQPQVSQQPSVRDNQPSLVEYSGAEDEQSPLDAQQLHSPKLASEQEYRIASSQRSAGTSATLATQNGQALTRPGAASRTASRLSYDSPHQSVALPLHNRLHDNNLSKESVISKAIRSSSPVSEGNLEEREQNAQVVSLEAVLSSQEDTAESIRTTIEKDYAEDRVSPESRHDSSQETPERLSRVLDHSSSPIPYPPSYSLRTQESKFPPRPCTPVPASSASNMAGESTADIVKRQMEEAIAKHRAENPFTPRKRANRSSAAPSVTAVEGSTASPAASRLLTAEKEGTRSPSAVPDRSPATQVPTSLRTVAYAPSVHREASPQDESIVSTSGAYLDPADTAAPAATESAVPDVPPSAGSDDMDLSDADDEDSESLLNDDLQLAELEFIVPLFIQGRQSDMYSQHIALKKDVLEQFLKDPHSVEPISKVEEILSYLRAIETHIDLVFAEAESGFLNDEMSMTQAAHAAQFGMENSTKFRFLHKLFCHLRDFDTQKHVVLVTEKDDDALFQILETFCEAKNINYDMPTRGHQTNPTEAEGNLRVTIIPNNASPIIHPADLIFQDATQIRTKNWGRSSDREVVPVIHLVIPRTVGHIERYIAPSLGPVERMHTILASLAHVRPDIGKAIDENTPRDTVCASLVAEWLMDTTEGAELSWPIPSIGSIKDVIEYQMQLSQPLANSPMPERTKRPLVVSNCTE